jgi:serine protease
MSIRLTLAVVLAALATGGAPLGAEVLKVRQRSPVKVASATWRNGELIVAFRDGTDAHAIEAVLREGHARSARPSLSGKRFLVRLDPGVSVKDAVARYARVPEVLYAEPNGVLRATQAATFTPDDRIYRYQWNFRQMNAERTWAIQNGQPAVAVAVLDTGIAYEDYVDPRTGDVFRKAPDWGNTVFLPGYDFVNADAHPDDDAFHGTHVASTIAEATNNATGAAGFAFGCAIMPVKVLDASGEGTFFDVAEGIDFAVNYEENGKKPVKVINLSLGAELSPNDPGFAETTATVTAAIDRAVAAGVLVVAAAGNGSKSVSDFPALLPNVVSVGALDARKQLAYYSNTGSDLDFVAPGGDCQRDDDGDGEPDCIWQQMPDFEAVAKGIHTEFCYCGLDGTSMATPHVSAAAALLFSQGFTDVASVRAALEQTAERLGGAPADGRNDTYGFGLVQPSKALPGMGLDR